jgi:hypothetical protein
MKSFSCAARGRAGLMQFCPAAAQSKLAIPKMVALLPSWNARNRPDGWQAPILVSPSGLLANRFVLQKFKRQFSFEFPPTHFRLDTMSFCRHTLLVNIPVDSSLLSPAP